MKNCEYINNMAVDVVYEVCSLHGLVKCSGDLRGNYAMSVKTINQDFQ